MPTAPTCSNRRASIRDSITDARTIPTRFALERCVADLEDGTAAFAFASGLAAAATVLELLDHGSHVLVCDDLYGGSYRLFERVRRRTANLDFTYVDPGDFAAFAAAVRPNTRMLWIETPSNPLLKLADLARIAELARRQRASSASPTTRLPRPTCSGPWHWDSTSSSTR